LADSTLELRDSGGALLASNDNWRTTQLGGIITADQVAEIPAANLAPTNDAESILIAMLAPGSYTAQIRGVNRTPIKIRNNFRFLHSSFEDSSLFRASKFGFRDFLVSALRRPLRQLALTQW